MNDIHLFQLESKVENLERQLMQAFEERDKFKEELQTVKSHSQTLQPLSKYSDPMAIIEQLSEVRAL